MELKEVLEKSTALVNACRKELAKRIVGQQAMIDGLLTGLVSGGHVLLEGVPGLAKTLAVKSLAEITDLSFKRIQFTPDLLPADLTGTLIWEQNTGTFSIRKGPVFASVILADEINRAPAKVQSALLEAMEEKQVTIGETSYPLPDPFFVLATENPIEQEGTYNLPEAELDRFLMKLLLSYPEPEEELEIVKRAASVPVNTGMGERLSVVLDRHSLEFLRKASNEIHIDRSVAEYMVSITAATRPATTRSGRMQTGTFQAAVDGIYRYLSFGASVRASIALHRCARILALFEGRGYVSPEDVKTAAAPVLRHRIVLSYEAEAEGLNADDVISRILSHIPVP